MKWPFSFNAIFRRKPVPRSPTQCPACGREMELIERIAMNGNDMRTYRCQDCQREEIVQMKWPFSFNAIFRRKPVPPALTQCSVCGREMELIERTTMTGNDMRTYRCQHCQREEIVDCGPALWKVLSDERNAQDKGS